MIGRAAAARGEGAAIDDAAVVRAALEEAVRTASADASRPVHYRVISVSLYVRDLERLDAVVGELKRRGVARPSRSAVIRHAIGLVRPDDVARRSG